MSGTVGHAFRFTDPVEDPLAGAWAALVPPSEGRADSVRDDL
jgi:hypothetical protein